MKRKSAAKDFSIGMLPKTRKEQFFDLFKTRGSVILKLCFVSLLGSLPILLLYGFKYFGVLPQALVHITNNDELLAFIRSNSIVFDAGYALGIVILFIVISGMGNIFKKMAWGEQILFLKDYKEGVKANWKQFIIVGLLIGILRFAVNTFASLTLNVWIKYIPYAIFIIILPIFLMALAIGNLYQSKLFNCFSNGTAYCFKKLPYVLIFLLFPIVGKVVSFIVNDYFAIPLLGGGLLTLVVLLLPIFILAWHLFSLSLFDEYTNKKYYPDFYHKGLADSIYLNQKRDNIFLL